MGIIERDLKHIWHPCSQMKDYETFKPLHIHSANGVYLNLHDGTKVIDAISSWWCKHLGHGHPRLKAALTRQMEKFEHVLLPNTTNDTIVELSEKLSTLTKNLNKVSYASDGSCAIEIAIKMSLHARLLQNKPHKNRLMSLENSYHGETLMTLSVSDLGLYKKPYESSLHDTDFIQHVPYITEDNKTAWHDCSTAWHCIEKQLNPLADTLSAILIEPIVQGAGGMLIYSQNFLKHLRAWCDQHDVHLIADEIMTGFGRTGKTLACEHAGIEPDFLCVAKGLTAGFLPLSATLTSDAIYDLFYDDYETGKAFMHSHTHTGNALAASVALEVFNILEEENINQVAQQLEQAMLERMKAIAKQTGRLHNIRGLGGIVAADLLPIPNMPRQGYAIYQKAVKRGALLRPLGNTLYWMPPLTINTQELDQLADITEKAILSTTTQP